MPAGILIVNDAGSILIDETYRNVALKAKGTVTMPAGDYPSVVVTVAGMVMPVIAVRSSAAANIGTVSLATGTFTVYAPAGASVTWYVFDPSAVPATSFGLQVFTATGACVFDSNQKYSRVRAVVQGATTSAWQGAYTYDVDRTYAVAFLQPAYQYQAIYTAAPGYPPGYYTAHGERTRSSAAIAGATVTFSFRKCFVGSETETPVMVGSPTPIREDGSMLAAILDVTGF